MNKKVNLNQSQISLVLLVANGGYASHYGFTIGEWLQTKKLVKETPNLIELNKKLNITPVNMNWDRKA